jgi:hypothetical protein
VAEEIQLLHMLARGELVPLVNFKVVKNTKGFNFEVTVIGALPEEAVCIASAVYAEAALAFKEGDE